MSTTRGDSGNRLVCSSNLFASLPRREALDAISRLGFSHVDLWGAPPIADHVEPLSADPVALRADIDRVGLQVSSVSLFLTTHDEKIAGMEIAAELGADKVVFEPGPSADWHTTMANLAVDDSRLIGKPGGDLQAFVDATRTYFDKAEELHIQIAIEVPHVATVIETTFDIIQFLELEHSPALSLTFAPPHLALAEEDLDTVLAQVEKYVSVFYFWNVKPGYRGSKDGRSYGTGEEQLSPDGALDLTSAAKRLLQDGLGRDYVISAHGTEQNRDRGAVSEMVRRCLTQVPEELGLLLKGRLR